MSKVIPAEQDECFMRETLRLADESVERGGGPFGAIIVKDGDDCGTWRQQRDA